MESDSRMFWNDRPVSHWKQAVIQPVQYPGEQEYSVRAAGFSTGTPDFCRISNASSVPDMPDTYLGTPRSNGKAIPVEIIMDRKLSSST